MVGSTTLSAEVPKNKRAGVRTKRVNAAPAPITIETVERLEKLAEALQTATDEASAVAEMVRSDVNDGMRNHIVDVGVRKAIG